MRNGGMEFVFRLNPDRQDECTDYLPEIVGIYADDDETARDVMQNMIECLTAASTRDPEELYYLDDVFIVDKDRFCDCGNERTLDPCPDCAYKDSKEAE